MKESKFEKIVCDTLKKLGCLPIKLQSSTIGMPDRLVLKPDGGYVLIELKTEIGKLSEIQLFTINKLRTIYNSTIYIISSQTDLYAMIHKEEL